MASPDPTADADGGPGFVIASREELIAFFDAVVGVDTDKTVDPEQLKLIARLGGEFEVLCRKLLENWSPILVSSGVVEFACKGLRFFGLGSYAAGVALRVLARVTEEGPEAHALLVQHEAAQLAVKTAKAHPENSRTQFYMLLLVAVVDDDAMRERAAEDGLFKSAIMAYRGHLFSTHDKISIPTIAARAVANVARYPITHREAVASEVLPWAVNLISGRNLKRVEDPETMEALCWVLANICAGGSYITSNVSGGFVFDALAACLRDFEAHAGVAESTACAVHFLLSDRAVMRSQPLDAEIPSALIRVAREHPKNPRVALAVLLALRSLCSLEDEVAESTVTAGAVSYAVRCLREFQTNVAVVKAAVLLLADAVANTAEARTELISFHGLEGAVAPVAKHPEDIELQEAFCSLTAQALKPIAGEAEQLSPNKLRPKTGASAVQLVAHAMVHHPLSASIQTLGCRALQSAAASDKVVVLGAAAAPNIAQALSVFTDDADLQLAAADALRELFAASAMGGAVRDVVHELLEEGIMGRLLEFGGVNSSVALQLSVLLALEALVIKGKPSEIAEHANEHDLLEFCKHITVRFAWRTVEAGVEMPQQIIASASAIIEALQTQGVRSSAPFKATAGPRNARRSSSRDRERPVSRDRNMTPTRNGNPGRHSSLESDASPAVSRSSSLISQPRKSRGADSTLPSFLSGPLRPSMTSDVLSMRGPTAAGSGADNRLAAESGHGQAYANALAHAQLHAAAGVERRASIASGSSASFGLPRRGVPDLLPVTLNRPVAGPSFGSAVPLLSPRDAGDLSGRRSQPCSPVPGGSPDVPPSSPSTPGQSSAAAVRRVKSTPGYGLEVLRELSLRQEGEDDRAAPDGGALRSAQSPDGVAQGSGAAAAAAAVASGGSSAPRVFARPQPPSGRMETSPAPRMGVSAGGLYAVQAQPPSNLPTMSQWSRPSPRGGKGETSPDAAKNPAADLMPRAASGLLSGGGSLRGTAGAPVVGPSMAASSGTSYRSAAALAPLSAAPVRPTARPPGYQQGGAPPASAGLASQARPAAAAAPRRPAGGGSLFARVLRRASAAPALEHLQGVGVDAPVAAGRAPPRPDGILQDSRVRNGADARASKPAVRFAVA